MRTFRILPLALILAFGVPACSSSDSGDDDSSTGDQTGTEQPGSTSAAISAADGGDVELGAAKVSIPGGALSDDVTVTVESTKPSGSLPDSSSLTGLVYDLGPNGTEFAKPVALTLPLPKAPGTGKEAVIAYLNEDSASWEDLPTTVAKDGAVSADIMHFSKYVIRIRNTNVDQGGGEVECTFTPCGGDPTGTWQIKSACITAEGGDDPFDGKCPDATVDVSIAADGSLVVQGGRYTWDLTVRGDVTFNIPASCVATLSNGSATTCGDFAGDDGKTSCTGSISTACACTQTGDSETQTSTGTLEVNGTQVIGTPDGDEPGSPSDFCVKGNSLKLMMHETDDDGTVKDIMLSLTK